MPSEIIALIDKPWLLAALLALGAVCGMAVERFVAGQEQAARRTEWKARNRRVYGKIVSFGRGPQLTVTRGSPASLRPDAAEQLRIVMNAPFKLRPLLNQPERRLLAVIDQALTEYSPGWRAMAQVCLGEILASQDQDAFLAINSKRVDLLIVDANCQPLHAIEFQGTGHHQGTAAARDAVKKEALRRGGIGYVEVVSGDTPAEVRAMVRKLVGRNG